MQSAPKKLLITGASGFLGWNLCHAASAAWQVVGTTFSHPIAFKNTIIKPIDLRDFSALKTLLDQVQPDGVIHTAAAKDPNFCQEQPSESRQINVDVAVNLAGLCADREIPFVFTSTDMVFDGTSAPYSETSAVSPLNTYGEQKVLAEELILARSPQAVICRLPLMFGDPGPVAQSFLQPLIAQLKSGSVVNLFTDEYRTPISGRAVTSGLLLALESAQGILHLGGSERISRFEFGRLVVESFNLTRANMNPCLQRDVVMAAPRPPDLSLDSSSANQLGFAPPSIAQQLKDLRYLP